MEKLYLTTETVKNNGKLCYMYILSEEDILCNVIYYKHLSNSLIYIHLVFYWQQILLKENIVQKHHFIIENGNNSIFSFSNLKLEG